MKILIKNANVFDGKHSQLKLNQNIIILDNIVEEIVGGEVSDENFDQILDAEGLTAIPGLTDAHVHFGHTFIENSTVDYDVAISSAVAKKLLYQGITSVRDAGGISIGLKKAIDQGVLEGPRIYPSNAYISQTSGHGDSIEAHNNRDIQYKIPTSAILADGVSEIQRAVREQLYRGASQIKLMAGGGCASTCDPLFTVQYSLEEMKAAVNTASDYGTYVMAHLYTPESMQRAIKAGIKSLEHGHLLDTETAKQIAANDIFLSPMPQFSEKEIQFSRIGLKQKKDDGVKKGKEKSKSDIIRAGMEQTTELINAYDLNILFGTDLMITYPQYEPRDSYDFTCYKQRFGSFKGLLAATGNVNALTNLTTYQNPYSEGEIGVLKQGAYADILLVAGNPVEDLDILSETENIKLIMKNGKVYKDII